MPVIALVLSLSAAAWLPTTSVGAISRRALLATPLVLPMVPLAARAAAPTEADLIAEIKAIQKALDLKELNGLIDEEKWDNVRSVLKVPPVGDAWQQSQNKKNPLKNLATLRDDIDLLETTDEIAAALQLADQYCYSNTFIYTQPGNGKMKFKEPKQQLQIAVDKMAAFIS